MDEIAERQLLMYTEILLRQLRKQEHKLEEHLEELKRLSVDRNHLASGTYQQSPKQP